MTSPPDVPAAVFFDAYGTLISWAPQTPPAQALASGLRGAGVRLPLDTVERAVAVEMAFYRAHQAQVRTPEQLAALRLDCARLLRDELGGEYACPLSPERLLELLLAAFPVQALPDAVPAIRRLRDAGLRTGVLSNFSYLLPLLLEEVGLAPLLDPVVFSAAVGAEKPDPAIFAAAARAVAAGAGDCVLIGDDLSNDIEGARAVGMPSIWISRDGAVAPPDVCAVSDLTTAAEACLSPGWRSLSLDVT